MKDLGYTLQKLGKNISYFVDILRVKDYMEFYGLDIEISNEINADEFDTLVCVDLSSVKQIGKYYDVFNNFENTIIIDHHRNGDLSAKLKYIDVNKSSCSEIIFDLCSNMKVELDSQFADYIYSGIIGDTNCFQNDNVNYNTLTTASKCIELNADKNKIVYLFMKKQKIETIKLKKLAYEKLVVKDGVAYTIITKKMQEEAGIEYCSHLVEELSNLEGVKVSFLATQKEKNVFSVSLRCKEGYDVSQVARIFGGGGHIQASGMSFMNAPIKNTKKILNECIKMILEKERN